MMSIFSDVGVSTPPPLIGDMTPKKSISFLTPFPKKITELTFLSIEIPSGSRPPPLPVLIDKD